MKTLFNALVLGAVLAVGSAFAGPSVDVVVSRSLNVDNLRDANLQLAGESASVRIGLGDFRLSLNGMDPDMASATVGYKHDLVGFDHVNVTFDKHTVGLGLSRDAAIAGPLSLTAGVGAVASNVHNLPTLTAGVGLVMNVW